MPVVAAGALIILLAAFVALGSAALSRSVSGGFIGWLEKAALQSLAIAGPLAEYALKLTRYVTHALGSHFAQIEGQAAAFLSGLAQYVELVGEATILWPYDLSRALYWLTHTEVPRLLRALPTSVTHLVQKFYKVTERITKVVYRDAKAVPHTAERVIVQKLPWSIRRDFPLLHWVRTHLRGIERAIAAAAAIAVALPRVIAHPVPIPWGRTVTGIRKRLRRLEKLLGATGAVALVTAAFVKMGLEWVLCKDFKRLGRRIGCGGFGLLADLLGSTFTALGVTDICALSGAVTTLAEWFRPLLIDLVDVENFLVGCHGATAPPDLQLTAYRVPPLVNAAPLV